MKNVVLLSFSSLAALVVSAGLLLAHEAPREPFSGLDRLDRAVVVRAVLDRNPTIEAARRAFEAAREREPQRASLADPRVSYDLAPLSIGSGDVRYGQRVGFAQRLPYPGKLRLEAEIARAEAEAARHGFEGVRLALATTASLLFDDYYFVARAIEIHREHVALLERFQRIATARYASGLTSQQAPLQAEVEVAHLLHRGVVLETERRIVAARLNALLHRAPDAELPPPPAELPEPVPVGRDADGDVRAIRPEVEARIAEVEARKAALRLREKDAYPDFELATSFSSLWGDPEYRWTVGLGIHLPIRRDRLRAASAEAKAALMEAESALSAIEDAVRAEVYSARERLAEAEHVVELYRSRLLPASRDQIRAAQAGFETGQNSFLALIEAERNERNVELGYEQARTDVHRRRAELDRALGSLPALSVEETAGGVK